MITADHSIGDSSWFCLRSQPKREQAAAANLRQRVAIDVFAPRIRYQGTTKRGLAGFATESLFPGYLFARFAYPRQLRHVVSTNGVSGIVQFGGRAPKIDDTVIEFLRSQVGESEQASPAPVFAEGSWVKILSGCFRHSEGRILDFDARSERVRVLLELLGREVQVSLSVRSVGSALSPKAQYPAGLMASESADVCDEQSVAC
jgi:transcriptional antiterminator RfaH